MVSRSAPAWALTALVAASLSCGLARDYDQIRPPGSWRFEPRFLRSIGGPLREDMLGCAVAGDGSVRVVGRTENGAAVEDLGTIDPENGPQVPDALWLHYDGEGSAVDSYRLDGTSATGFNHVTVVGDDDYLVGFASGDVDLGDQELVGSTSFEALVMRRSEGQTVWSALGIGNGAAVATGVDSIDGRVVVVGRFGRTLADIDDSVQFEGCDAIATTGGRVGIVANLDAEDGSCRWLETVDTEGSDLLTRGIISPAPLRPIIVAGRTRGLPLDMPEDHDLWLGAFDSRGRDTWSRNPESPGGLADLRDVTASSSVTCAVGFIEAPVEVDSGKPLDPGEQSDGLILCRAVGSGDELWTGLVGASGAVRLDGTSVDGQRLVIGGSFGGSLDVGDREFVAPGVTAGLLAVYDINTADLLGSAAFGGAGSLAVSDLDIDAGTLCVTGSYTDELTIGEESRASVDDSTDGFLAVFDLLPPD